jgi:hypothetical protein
MVDLVVVESEYARDEGEGRMATSSALAVWRSLNSFESVKRSEPRDDHQVPDGRRCMRAYFLPCPV